MTKTIMIIGGGATSLYLRSFFYQHGYDVILVEKKSLGTISLDHLKNNVSSVFNISQ